MHKKANQPSEPKRRGPVMGYPKTYMLGGFREYFQGSASLADGGYWSVGSS